MIVERPWGYFEVLENKATHKVKRIVVYGNQRLSLQSHTMRAETWVVVRGEGIVTINDSNISVKAGDCVIIPMNAKHRVKNIGESYLEFIEVQTGQYFGEDDIIRYSDDYGRSL